MLVAGSRDAARHVQPGAASQPAEPPWPNLLGACSWISAEMPTEPVKSLWHFWCLAEFAALCSLRDEDESRGS